jgi:transposase-like protein
VVYLWPDGLYVKAGLEREKAALLVVIGAFADGHKEVLAVSPGYRESTESWAAVLRDLAARGLKPPRLVVGDGHLGRWAALPAIWPEVAEQRCWNHKVLNVLDQLPRKVQAGARVPPVVGPCSPRSPMRPRAPRRSAGGRPSPAATAAGIPRR